jgi:Coenzyme F420-dependent N5,N10-methylene tetrahydromethanopterin reductase and related flavin-dependent oxidoreductases
MTAPHIGYAAMLEQFGPQEVVGYCQQADQSGFSGTMAADHFQPWVPQQGQAAFVWNVLTAVGERTTGDLGPGVTCPSFRFHRAIVAQAATTLEAMYPGRHWLGLGSGEVLNEHVVGGYELKNYLYGLEFDVGALAPFHDLEGVIPADAQAELEQLAEELRSGAIELPTTQEFAADPDLGSKLDPEILHAD